MRVTPIKEIADLEADEKIMAVHGRVKQVYGFSSGTNAHGDWSIQNIIIADRTGEIKVKIKDHDEIPKAWKGKDVLIECTKHDKHGWIGVKAVDDEWTKKGASKPTITRIVSISKTGNIDLATEASDSEGGDEERRPQRQQREERPPAKDERSAADAMDDDLARKAEKVWDTIKIHVGATGIKGKTLPELDKGQLAWLTNSWLARANKDNEDDVMLVAALLAMKKAGSQKPAGDNKLPLDKIDENKQPAAAGSHEAIMEVKRSMVQRANLMKLAIAAVRTIVLPEFKEGKVSDDQFQSFVGQVYIGAERAGLHHKLPMAPMNGEHGEKKKDEKK